MATRVFHALSTAAASSGDFNVRGYGAIGDNTADDTAAVQAAVAAAVAAGGGVVYFPAGTYRVDGSLILDNNVTLAGVGIDSQIKQVSTTADLITGTTVSWVTIRDLRIQGPATGSGRGVFFGDNGNSSNAEITVQNVLLHNFGGTGIEIQTCIVSNFIGVVVRDCGSHGFAFTTSHTGGTSISMNGCYAHNCPNAGFLLSLMHYSTLLGCAADSCGTGYYLDTCQAVNLAGCGSETCVVTNATYDGSAFHLSGGNTCSLLGCYNYQNNAIAVKLTAGAESCMVSRFRENTPLGGATASISIATGCLRNTVDACKVTTAFNFAGSVVHALPDSSTVPAAPATGVEFYSASGVPKAKSSNGTVYPLVRPSSTLPEDLLYAGWSYDPIGTSASTTTVAGTVYLSRVYLREPVTATKLWTIINVAGATPTAGQNWIGVYNSAGTLLASASLDAVVASTGPVSAVISQALSAGAYWVAVLFNAGAQPQIGRTSAQVATSNTPQVTASNLRFAINGTGRTTLASPITPASNTSGSAFWVGIS